jgi:hypothetical protein
MIILITTTKSLLAYDFNNDAIYTIHQGYGLYYGIAYNNEFIFVGARNNNNNEATSNEDRENERAVILVFDYALNLVEKIVPPFQMRDIHQLYYYKNKLYITCSFDNMIAIYDFKNWKKWHPLEKHNKDFYHFNSINSYKDLLIVLAHNWDREPSKFFFIIQIVLNVFMKLI